MDIEQRFIEMLKGYNYPLRQPTPSTDLDEYKVLRKKARWRNGVCVIDFYNYHKDKLISYADIVKEIEKELSDYV